MSDIVVAEGLNELNVQMTPVAQVSHWSYANLRCSSPWDPTGDHPIYDIECDVTNVGSARETRTVQLWTIWDGATSWWMLNSVEVTLDPGETYHYHYREGYIPWDKTYHCAALVTDNTAEKLYIDSYWRTDMPFTGDMSSICSFYAGFG